MQILVALMSVAVGFGLSECKSFFAAQRRVRRLRQMVLEEIRAVQSQIPQKRDIIEKIIKSLDNDQILPGGSVRSPRAVYEYFYPEALEELSERQRNSVHVIYEYSRIIDDEMDGYERQLREELSRANSNQPIKDSVVRFADILHVLDVLQELVQHHLAGDPIDVFPETTCS